MTMSHDEKTKLPAPVIKALPWLAGAGFATGQILAATRCSVPEQGQCSACGSCVIALGSLVTWALVRQRDKEDFFIDKSGHS